MICTKCKKTVRVISKFLDDKLTNSLEIAHAITTEVAKVVDNPLFQLLVSQLPAGANVTAVLNVIDNVLSKAQKVITCEHLTGIDRVNCLMNSLNILPKDERNSILLRLKSALTAEIDGGRFEQYVYDTAGQLDYFNEKIKSGAPVEKDGTFIEVVKDATTEANLTQGFVQTENVVQIAEKVLTEPTHAMPLQSTPIATPPTPRSF